MTNKMKELLKNLPDIVGYMSAAGFTALLTYIVYRIHIDGTVRVAEPNIYIRLSEIGLGGTTVLFLIYKLAKDIIRREKKNEK